MSNAKCYMESWDNEAEAVEAADKKEQERAAEYLALIGDDEVERRLALRPDVFDDRDNPRGSDQGCPVCLNETIISRPGCDDFGTWFVEGTCWVCSYHQSPGLARQLAEKFEFQRRWDKD